MAMSGFRETLVCRRGGRVGGHRRRQGADAGRAAAGQQRRQSLPRHPRLGAAHARRTGRGAASNGVAIDRDGKSVWATDRCSPGIAPGCLGTKANPVHLFDDIGKEVRSFGGGMFVWPHGIHVDRDGNVWVADARVATPAELKKFPGEDNKGSVVVKFSPDGKVLMTLGKPGVRGNPPEALTDPNDVVTDPGNGDIYVAESHTNVEDPNLVGRISVFDRNGKFLRTIGKTGTGPGEFRTPHMIKFDSQGRLIVADRHNHRIQILTKDGKYLGEYREFGRVERDRDRWQRHALCGRFRIDATSATRAGSRASASAA